MINCASTEGFIKNQERYNEIKTIAVLPFVANDRGSSAIMAEAIQTNLMNSRFKILERSQLTKILQENALTMSGIVEGNESFVGKLSGVDALVMGSLTMSNGFAGMMYGGNIDYVSNCSARLVDCQNGEVLASATFSNPSASNMSGVINLQDVARKIARKLSGN